MKFDENVRVYMDITICCVIYENLVKKICKATVMYLHVE